MNKYEKLYNALKEIYGHSNEIFLLTQVAYVALGKRGGELHDDTCNYITSEEWLNMEKEENRLARIIPVEIHDSYPSYMKAIKHMEEQDVKDLGWVNAGISIPTHCEFQRIYKNYFGSFCLYVDPIHRVMYSVDMGD